MKDVDDVEGEVFEAGGCGERGRRRGLVVRASRWCLPQSGGPPDPLVVLCLVAPFPAPDASNEYSFFLSTPSPFVLSCLIPLCL